MTNMTGSKLSIFSHPGKITGFWITTRSFPYRCPYGPGQYGPRLRLRQIWVFLFQMSEVCNKQFNTWAFPYCPGYHPSTHIGGLGMITRPLWKCPYINMYILLSLGRYFGRLLVSQGIFCSVVSVSTLTWFIKYIYHCDVPVRKGILK